MHAPRVQSDSVVSQQSFRNSITLTTFQVEAYASGVLVNFCLESASLTTLPYPSLPVPLSFLPLSPTLSLLIPLIHTHFPIPVHVSPSLLPPRKAGTQESFPEKSKFSIAVGEL